MEPARKARAIAWGGALTAAVAVVAGGLVRRSPTADEVTGRPALPIDRRAEVHVPAAGEDAWRTHRSILSATAAVGLEEGWLVLDARSSRVHRLDRSLDLVGSFGGRGDGPGQLAWPTTLATSGDTLVAVMDGSGTRIDLFAPDGRFLGRTRVRVPGCPLGLSGGLVPWRDGFVTHGLCGGPGGARWAVAATGLDGRARVVASVPLGSDGRVGSLLGRGVLSWQDRIWIGSPDGCFSAVLPEAGERACMAADDLPALPDSIRRALAPRGRVGGYEVALPERWPAFVGTEWSPRGPLLVLPPDATSPDGALAVLEPDGSLTVVRSPERAWPGPVALLLARTRLDGTAFRVEGWR